MAVNLSSLLETLSNPDGRFRSLEGIYPVLNPDGEPVMRMSSISADFEVVFNDKPHTLRCLTCGEETGLRLKNICQWNELMRFSYVTPSRFLSSEMLVYNSSGAGTFIDVVIERRPDGVSLEEFARQVCDEGDTGRLRGVLEKLSELARWMVANQYSHGRMNSRVIFIDRNHTPVLLNCSDAVRKPPLREIASLGKLVAALWLCSCEPAFYKHIKEQLTGLSEDGGELRVSVPAMIELLRAEGPESLLTLLNRLQSGVPDADSVETVCDCLEQAARCPDRKISALDKMVRDLDGGIPGTEEAERTEDKIYLYVGEPSDNIRRAYDGTKWYYLDRNGERCIQQGFDLAADFMEGRAVVESAGKFGLIDYQGNFVIEPLYDDIDWDCRNNIAIVTAEGRSGIISRTGEQITGMIFEQVLGMSEGLILVRSEGLYGYVDKEGRQVIGCQYDDAFGFRDGYARVTKGNRQFLVDTRERR